MTLPVSVWLSKIAAVTRSAICATMERGKSRRKRKGQTSAVNGATAAKNNAVATENGAVAEETLEPESGKPAEPSTEEKTPAEIVELDESLTPGRDEEAAA